MSFLGSWPEHEAGVDFLNFKRILVICIKNVQVEALHMKGQRYAVMVLNILSFVYQIQFWYGEPISVHIHVLPTRRQTTQATYWLNIIKGYK